MIDLAQERGADHSAGHAGAARRDPDTVRADANAGLRLVGQVRRGEAAKRRQNVAVPANPTQLVDVADEARGGKSRWLAVQVLGGSTLNKSPLVQQRDPIGKAHRLTGVVRDEDRRRAGLAEQLQGVLTDAIAQTAIEAGECFVHEQHAWARQESASQRDALLLASRQHVRVAVRILTQPHAVEHHGHP